MGPTGFDAVMLRVRKDFDLHICLNGKTTGKVVSLAPGATVAAPDVALAA